jgi:carbon-monoxide dehydrogenase medium subunit
VAPTPAVLDLTDALGPEGDVSVAARTARDAVHPETDIHASAEYRRHLAGVLTARVIGRALAAARTARSAA